MALPAKFGPPNGIDSKDYLFKMQTPGSAATDPLTSILGHSLTSPSQNLTDDVTFEDVELVDGVIEVVSRIKRAGQETNRTYTIGIPSAIWTPVVEQTLRKGCQSNFFLVYLCPEDPIYEHWDILEDSTLKPVIEAEDVITTGADTNIITQTSEVTVTKKRRGYGLGFLPIYDAGGTVAYNDIVFTEDDCPGCDHTYAQGMIAVGGDGTAVPTQTLTTDRFNNVTALTTGAAATNVADAVYTKGDFILVSSHITATPTAGLLHASYDGGTTWSVIADVPEVIFDIVDADGTLVLVGGDATDGGRIYLTSDRAQTITEITGSSVIPASTALNAAAYDKRTRKVYIVGDSGVLLVGRLSGSTLTLTDISANLPGAPGNLTAVCVVGPNEILVGGAAGYLVQSRDSGLTWTEVGIGTSSTIASIAGNRWRTTVAAGTALFERTALTDNAFQTITLQDGATVTGDYTRLRMNLGDDFNRFIGTTDDGEIVLGVPFYPNA